jgi:predicted O-methyltransferase YrrM
MGQVGVPRRRLGPTCQDRPVDATVQKIVDELVAAAGRHDATKADRLDRWRVLEPDAGRFLWFLTQAVGARTIVEVGTSRGVSTLYLADAARRTGGRVVSLDTDATAQEHARRSLTEAGLADHVTLRAQDGGAALSGLPDASVDLLFLDAERTEYAAWWPHPARVLRAGGVLVADNALSHPEEIAPLRTLIAQEPGLTTTTIGVGKGELLALRGARSSW